MRDRKGRSAPAVLAFAFLTSLAVPPGLALGETGREATLELTLRAQRLAFVGEGRLLLVSNTDGRLALLDIDDGHLVTQVAYSDLLQGKRFDSLAFTDVAVAPDSQTAYLIGQLFAEHPLGVIVQVDTRSLASSALLVAEPFRQASIAVARFSRLILGDVESNTIIAAEQLPFDSRPWQERALRTLGQNVYLKDGPPADLGVSLDGRFVVISHAYTPTVTLLDTRSGETVDRYSAVSGRQPLALALARSAAAERDEPTTSVVIASRDLNYLALADVNSRFHAFDRVAAANLSFRESPFQPGLLQPVFISASADLATIVVASRTDPLLEILQRVPAQVGVARGVGLGRKSAGLERTNIVRLNSQPIGIDVSADGQVVAVLLANERSILLVRNPIAWSSEAGIATGSDSMREVQRLLGSLGYPIGTVDGLNGPRTQDAIVAFKESTALRRDALLDERTLRHIREVASELPPPSESHLLSAGGETAKCRPIEREELCVFRTTSIEPIRTHPEKAIEEVVCAANSSQRLVQIDRYTLDAEGQTYHCSGFHSCAFVRYRDVVAYDRVCAKPDAAKKR